MGGGREGRGVNVYVLGGGVGVGGRGTRRNVRRGDDHADGFRVIYNANISSVHSSLKSREERETHFDTLILFALDKVHNNGVKSKSF